MPIYEYKCISCTKIVEELYTYPPPGKLVCICGSPMVRIPSIVGGRYRFMDTGVSPGNGK